MYGCYYNSVAKTPVCLLFTANVMLATVGGVTVGNFWLVLWWASGSPMLSLIMATLSLGYLVTCVLFYSALGTLSPLANSNGTGSRLAKLSSCTDMKNSSIGRLSDNTYTAL